MRNSNRGRSPSLDCHGHRARPGTGRVQSRPWTWAGWQYCQVTCTNHHVPQADRSRASRRGRAGGTGDAKGVTPDPSSPRFGPTARSSAKTRSSRPSALRSPMVRDPDRLPVGPIRPVAGDGPFSDPGPSRAGSHDRGEAGLAILPDRDRRRPGDDRVAILPVARPKPGMGGHVAILPVADRGWASIWAAVGDALESGLPWQYCQPEDLFALVSWREPSGFGREPGDGMGRPTRGRACPRRGSRAKRRGHSDRCTHPRDLASDRLRAREVVRPM